MLKASKKSSEVKHVGGATANITTLCLDGAPQITGYIQDDLRAHLAQCFKTQQISLLLAPDRPRRLDRQRNSHSQTAGVFCVLPPWNQNDRRRGPLVQCQICKQWLHQVCMGIREEIIGCPALMVNCKECLRCPL